ncbi:hypothetical protein POM88_015753 [Heracleum sosnowskyi]|uniref:Uncharacterized protein n=1 Tax=Heracleum sosnowskyi TaxID=360622 RepID=A0AAD8IKU3_9APIA|nr:hypothetical protein POM88_015753 [Heracleum sosnowskyi]
MPYSGIEILEEMFTNGHYLCVSKISIDDGVRGSWCCDLGENGHNGVHVSMLRQYTIDARHMLKYEQVDIQPGLTYKEQPVEITDRKEQVLRDKVAKLVRGLWKIKKWKNPPGS